MPRLVYHTGIGILLVAGAFLLTWRVIDPKLTFRIRGKVTLDGKPLAGARVYLFSFATRTWRGGGDTAPDGSFSFSGLPPGAYKFSVDKLVGHGQMGGINTLPPRYSDLDNTPLRCTVPSWGEVRLVLRSDP